MGSSFMVFLLAYLVFLGFVLYMVDISDDQIKGDLGISELDSPSKPVFSGNILWDFALTIYYVITMAGYFIVLFFSISISGWFGAIIGLPALVMFIWALARLIRGGG